MKPPMTPGFGLSARLFAGLAFLLLLAVIACSQSSSPTNVSPPLSLTPVDKAFPRNHVPQSGSWQLVYVTFTPQTSYEQAEQALREKGMSHYPMVNAVPCGDLRNMKVLDPMGSPCPEGTAMTTGQLQADFSQSHRMLVVSDSWEKLNRMATDSRVVSKDPYPVPKHT